MFIYTQFILIIIHHLIIHGIEPQNLSITVSRELFGVHSINLEVLIVIFPTAPEKNAVYFILVDFVPLIVAIIIIIIIKQVYRTLTYQRKTNLLKTRCHLFDT